MTTHDAHGRELFVCTECKCRSTAEHYDVDRHGNRRKTCLACKRRREARKCAHGKQKWDCRLCAPDKFCKHGKCKIRQTCSVCNAAGYERRMHIRNAREFATQPDGWPYEHVCRNTQTTYDSIVNKWKAIFAKLLDTGDIDEDLHTKILANLKPWDAEGYERRIQNEKEQRELAEIDALIARTGQSTRPAPHRAYRSRIVAVNTSSARSDVNANDEPGSSPASARCPSQAWHSRPVASYPAYLSRPVRPEPPRPQRVRC